jgi:hypothetical protein
MGTEIQKKEFVYDAFISCSWRNGNFAEALDKKLSEYKPPNRCGSGAATESVKAREAER